VVWGLGEKNPRLPDYFLSYDAQVKVGFDTGFDPFTSNHAAGILFRLDDNATDSFSDDNTFGLSFLRSESAGDTIPDGIVPTGMEDKTMIVLWQQTGSGMDWLAYKDISDSGSLSDNMESGTGGWTAESGCPRPLPFPTAACSDCDGLWHRSSRKAYGGSYAWYYGQEATGTYESDNARNCGSLVSQPVNLCGATTAELKFWSWYYTEWDGDGDPNDPTDIYTNVYDLRHVDVSIDNGQTWDLAVFELRTDNTPPNLMQVWEEITVDLTAYVGNAVLVRFRFDTRDNVWNHFEGWYIDDVTVTRTPDGEFEIDEATLLVRLQESASITFTSGSDGGGADGIKNQDVIKGQTSAATATVIATPVVASGAWGSDNAGGIIQLYKVTGTFSAGESLTAAGSTATATVSDFIDRANYIRAYYANPSDCGSANDDLTDDNKHGNPRNTSPPAQFYWPPEEVIDWAAASDYYRLVPWDAVNTAGVLTIELIDALDEPGAILESTESDLFTPTSGPFVHAELGLHTFGGNSTSVYFDDFALQTQIISTGEFFPPIQE